MKLIERIEFKIRRFKFKLYSAIWRRRCGKAIKHYIENDIQATRELCKDLEKESGK